MHCSQVHCVRPWIVGCLQIGLALVWFGASAPLSAEQKPAPVERINIDPPLITRDASVAYDFDIVYVRGLRREDGREAGWAEFSNPIRMEVGADLMLLHPNGTEEVLVDGEDGSVLDPYVSFDGEWVYYAKFIDDAHSGSDLYKIHVASRTIVKLTDQTRTPNTGIADWDAVKIPYGVYNLGPCPLPGGRVMYTSNRNVYVPPRGYPKVTLQLFTMDDDGANIEQIGYLNIAGALHPVILKDGTVIFSSLESQGLHNGISWGIWRIRPDGTEWGPVVSALFEGGAPSAFHFQTQLSDETIVLERYYNQNQKGFGTLFTVPPVSPADEPAFGPGDKADPRNRVELAGFSSGGRSFQSLPFSPAGMANITPWIHWQDRPSPPSIREDENSPRIGKLTHPCAAPDNHLLVAWTMGPIGGSAGAVKPYMNPRIMDSGLCLIKKGSLTREPGDMLLIKNDPRYNEQWPRPLVSYKRIHGVDQPATLAKIGAGEFAKHLPEGTPYGLVGTSSNYKRESAPGGTVPPGSVTAVVPPKGDWSGNWQLQGSDAGLYDNSEVHAIRIVAQEPLSPIKGNRHLYGSHANERLRILGEIPLRKFDGDQEPLDPDGNPDTSFLAKIPADQSFTFQLINKEGMTLTMAQTWHQVRPGEVRYNCGGCHAHSQQPTDFNLTQAARPDYKLFDLTKSTPLLTSKAGDESGKKWDAADESGLRYVAGLKNVEYHRDIKPIFARSCAACHTQSSGEPAGGLVLDDHDEAFSGKLANGDGTPIVELPGPYFHLAASSERVPPIRASRYVVKLQSRRSLLVWKMFGRRLDGLTKDTVRDDAVDFTGGIMPPPEAVAGTYRGADGKQIKVAALSDEDRRTIIRWIDLGCPIDQDPAYDATAEAPRSYSWMGDEQRPTLTMSYPQLGANPPLTRVLVGMQDTYTGLDAESFTATADFELDGVKPGENLASKFKPLEGNRWELALSKPLTALKRGTLSVSVKDRQGNIQRIDRTFSVQADSAVQ